MTDQKEGYPKMEGNSNNEKRRQQQRPGTTSSQPPLPPPPPPPPRRPPPPNNGNSMSFPPPPSISTSAPPAPAAPATSSSPSRYASAVPSSSIQTPMMNLINKQNVTGNMERPVPPPPPPPQQVVQQPSSSSRPPPPPPPPPPLPPQQQVHQSLPTAPPPPPPPSATSGQQQKPNFRPTPSTSPRQPPPPQVSQPHHHPSTSPSRRLRPPAPAATATMSPARSNQTYLHPSSNEPYGRTTATTNLRHRDVKPASTSPFYPPTPQTTTTTPTPSPKNKKASYQHNLSTSLLLLPPLLLSLITHSTPYPFYTLLFCVLLVYMFDLANIKDGTAISVWVGFAATSVSFVIGGGNGHGSGEGGGGWKSFGLGVVVWLGQVLLLFCMGCWSMLQVQWLHHDTTAHSFSVTMERLLHSLLPPVSSALMSHLTSTLLYEFYGLYDVAATSLPFIYCIWMFLGIYLHSCVESSFKLDKKKTKKEEGNKDATENEQQKKEQHKHKAIKTVDGTIHTVLLLILPPCIHFITFLRRITFSYSSWDDVYDMALSITVPFLLHHLLLWRGDNDVVWWKRSIPFYLRTEVGRVNAGNILPIVAALVASISFQMRYVISICASTSYLLRGHDENNSATTFTRSPSIIAAYLTTSSILYIFSTWFWNRKSTKTGEVLFGEAHEDVFSCLLAVGTAALALAFGVPFMYLPVPILNVISFTLWLITGMLRYFFLVVFSSSSAVLIAIAYRLSYIGNSIDILPGISISLGRFAQIGMILISVLGLVVGLVYRASGGFGERILKKIDATGMLFSLHTVLLFVMECALMKQPPFIPFRSEVVEFGEGVAGSYMKEGTYAPILAFTTSLLTVVISWHMRKVNVIKLGSTITIISFSVGKILALIIENTLVLEGAPVEGENSSGLGMLLLRSGVATTLLMTIFSPYVFMEPVHVKTSFANRKRFGPSAKPVDSVPKRARHTIVLYCAVILPLVIVASVPMVIRPLWGILAGQNSAYYSKAPTLSEILGYSMSLWGVAVLSMLNYFLPDGGKDEWRKVSALCFLMGLALSFAAPTGPKVGRKYDTSEAAFASISSVGGEIMYQNRISGWGLLSAFLATLLAMTGPLELRERKDRPGRKDASLLLRVMIFSTLFGCGISWFITLQSMSGQSFISTIFVLLSCLAVCFIGTIAIVLGYYLDAKEFEEVEQVTQVMAVLFPLALFMSGCSKIFKVRMFGMGGWLSTYLSVSGFVALAFAIALRSRNEKSGATRGMGNLSCVFSWICSIIVLYGRYGVSGADVSPGLNKIFGFPTSVIGTFLFAPILLVLEGETTQHRMTRRSYRLSSAQKKSKAWIGLNISSLTSANRFAPLVAGTASILLLASLYAIFIRGCGLRLPRFLHLPQIEGFDVHKSHEDVFASLYGPSSRTTDVGGNEDAATMAQKIFIHNEVVKTSAKLAGSGFWTSQSVFGPSLHVVGVAATIPNLYSLFTYMWKGTTYSAYSVMAMLPLNIFPLLISTGIPSLKAAALLGFFGGLYQIVATRKKEWIGRMRI